MLCNDKQERAVQCALLLSEDSAVSSTLCDSSVVLLQEDPSPIVQDAWMRVCALTITQLGLDPFGISAWTVARPEKLGLWLARRRPLSFLVGGVGPKQDSRIHMGAVPIMFQG